MGRAMPALRLLEEEERKLALEPPLGAVKIARTEEEEKQLAALEPTLGAVNMVRTREELDGIIAQKRDMVVMLTFTWCRPCKQFWPKYNELAKVYKQTIFCKIVGNECESNKDYARDELHVKKTPMFAVYRHGDLVANWTGGNLTRFQENLEANLLSAKVMEAKAQDTELVEPVVPRRRVKARPVPRARPIPA